MSLAWATRDVCWCRVFCCHPLRGKSPSGVACCRWPCWVQCTRHVVTLNLGGSDPSSPSLQCAGFCGAAGYSPSWVPHHAAQSVFALVACPQPPHQHPQKGKGNLGCAATGDRISSEAALFLLTWQHQVPQFWLCGIRIDSICPA